MASDPLKGERGTSFLACYCSMCNTILGAGVLSLPYAFSITGWVTGSVLLAIGGLFNSTGCNLLALCAMKTGTPASLYSLMRPLGKWYTLAVDVNIVIQLFGTAVAYLIVVGDLMPAAFEQLGATGAATERQTCVLMAFCFAAPLSIPHNIKWLGTTSGFSVFFLIYVAFLVFLFSLPSSSTGLPDPCSHQDLDDDGTPCKGDTSLGDNVDVLDFLEAMSIFIFGFASQITTFPIVNELVNVTQTRLNRVFMASTLTGIALYVVVSFCAYSTYGDSIKSDLLLNYPKVGAVSAARIMISFVVTFSFPLQINPTRRCLLTILRNFVDDDMPVAKSIQSVRYYTITAIFLAGALALALTVTDLGIVIALVGAFGGTLIMFILPGYLFLYHFPEDEDQQAAGAGAGEALDKRLLGGGGSESMSGVGENGLLLEPEGRDIPLPVVTKSDRVFAWIHLVLGVIIGPLCCVAIFL
jgi:amino acid permease